MNVLFEIVYRIKVEVVICTGMWCILSINGRRSSYLTSVLLALTSIVHA